MLVSHNHCSGHLNIPIFAFQLKQRNKNVDLKIIYFGIIIKYQEMYEEYVHMLWIYILQIYQKFIITSHNRFSPKSFKQWFFHPKVHWIFLKQWPIPTAQQKPIFFELQWETSWMYLMVYIPFQRIKTSKTHFLL